MSAKSTLKIGKLEAIDCGGHAQVLFLMDACVTLRTALMWGHGCKWDQGKQSQQCVKDIVFSHLVIGDFSFRLQRWLRD